MLKFACIFGFLVFGFLAPPEVQDPSFDHDVLPWMTKLGCNSGKCHGAAAGRGGFHLSLFASDPASDYEAIVHELEGRRIDRIVPERSLILTKPTGFLDHGGGFIAGDDSEFAAVLTAWIAKGGKRTTPRVVLQLDVQPREALVSSPEELVELQVHARFSDGSEEIVTSKSSIILPDDGSVTLLDNNKLRVNRPGQHIVMVRYLDKVLAVTFLRKFSDAVIANQPLPKGNLIDTHIVRKLRELGLSLSPAVEDSRWLRRVTLDLTGRLPSLDELEQFRSDSSPDRSKTVADRLLSSEAFVDFWTFRLGRWLNVRQEADESVAFEAYRTWLRRCVELDVGLDQMARELLLAEGDSHVVGPANFHRLCGDARKEAEVAARLFMGTRMECANCHDHPLDRWKQEDYHGFAALFAGIQRGRLVSLAGRGVVNNPKTGEAASPRIPGVTVSEQAVPTLRHFADWLTKPDNPYFAPAITNMLWKRLFGRGLVEPYNDFRETNPATHPQLLQALANQCIRDGYRLRPFLKELVLSQTYWADCNESVTDRGDDRFFSRAVYRPLDPEVYLDAIQDVLATPSSHQSGFPRERAIRHVDRGNADSSVHVLSGCVRQLDCSNFESGQLGLAAQLHLMNSDLINAWLTHPNGQLQVWEREQIPFQERLENIYLRALSRSPTESEREIWNTISFSENLDERAKLFEDFVWSLLVSREFRCNH